MIRKFNPKSSGRSLSTARSRRTDQNEDSQIQFQENEASVQSVLIKFTKRRLASHPLQHYRTNAYTETLSYITPLLAIMSTPTEVEIPEEFVCPITQQLFQDPVMDCLKHTYERNAILSWIGAHGTCPLTRRPLKPSNLIPNVLMDTRIALWKHENGLETTFSKSGHDEEEFVCWCTLEDHRFGSTEEVSRSGNGEMEDYRLAQLAADITRIQRHYRHAERVNSRRTRRVRSSTRNEAEARAHRRRGEASSEATGNQKSHGFRLFGGRS
jgi:hypothetical protein